MGSEWIVKTLRMLRISAYFGCGFEGDSKDAKGILDYIAALESENERLKEDRRWIPVSERLPDNWKPVLTIDMSESTRVPVPAFYDPETSLWSTHLPNYDLWVTHWMPLPPNPESPNDTQTQTIVYGKEREE